MAHMNTSWHTDKWVMARRRVSHGTHMDEWWHVDGWVMAHIWMSHGTQMNGTGMISLWSSYHTEEWVMAYTRTSHGTLVDESWHTDECDKLEVIMVVWSRVRMCHGTCMNESLHTHEWVMAHTWMSHGTLMNESWHVDEWVMAHRWMRHTGMHYGRLIIICATRSLVPWLIHLYAMTSLSVPHDSCICVPWLFLCLFHDKSICVPCRIHPAATFRDSQIFTQLGWDIYKSQSYLGSTTPSRYTHTQWTPRYRFLLGWRIYRVNRSGLSHHHHRTYTHTHMDSQVRISIGMGRLQGQQ